MILWLERRSLSLGAQGETGPRRRVLAVDGGFTQHLRHVRRDQQDIGLSALHNVIAFTLLTDGHLEAVCPAHQPQDLAAALLMPFLNVFKQWGSTLCDRHHMQLSLPSIRRGTMELPAGTASPPLAEAVIAVDRPVLSGLKGNLRLSAALAAHDVMHDPLGAPAVAAAALGATGLTTGGTTLGVLIASGSVELLISCREVKLSAAVGANNGPVLESHSNDLPFVLG